MQCALCGYFLTNLQCSACGAPYCAGCGAFYCANPACAGYAISKKSGLSRREACVYLGGLAGLAFLAAQQHLSLGSIQSSTVSPTSQDTLSSSLTVDEQQRVAHSGYVSLARQCAIENGLDADCFVRQINQESGFNPAAVSSAGAIGIAQFMPETAAHLGIDPHDPVQSLQGAARLMAQYVSFYQGSYALALAAYNAGGAVVNDALARGGSANWYAYLPAETQHYITAILGS